MKTKLLIEIYKIEEEEFFNEIDISNYNLKKINKICPPYDEFDYEYCGSYEIEENDFIELSKFIKELADYKFEDYSYSLITRRISK